MTTGTSGGRTEDGLVRLRCAATPSAAAVELLDRAARFDTAMGFGPPRPAGGGPATPTTVIEIDTCLHRHDVDHDDAYVLAGVLTVRDLGRGSGTADLVVDPRRRAIGVATASLEALSTVPERGWADAGPQNLHAVAHGSHPAAERLARRAGLAAVTVRHHLVLATGEPVPIETGQPLRSEECIPDDDLCAASDGTVRDPPAVRLVHDAGTARVRRPRAGEPGQISAVAPDPDARGQALDAALAVIASATDWLRRHGADDVEAIAADTDELLLTALRRLRFEHDRSDQVFRVGPHLAPRTGTPTGDQRGD